MLDIQVIESMREVKVGDEVIPGIPDIVLGTHTPLPRQQVLRVADEMADLGAEQIHKLTQQLMQVGILDTFMQYIKVLSNRPHPVVRDVIVGQMRAMRARYPYVLYVPTKPGKRSDFWDFFNKREALIADIANKTTPVQLLGVVMNAEAEYRGTQDPAMRSFLARGVVAGIENLKNNRTNDVPTVLKLLGGAKVPYKSPAQTNSEERQKVSFGRWYDKSYKHPSRNLHRKKAARYGYGFADRYGYRSY